MSDTSFFRPHASASRSLIWYSRAYAFPRVVVVESIATSALVQR